MSDDKNIPAMHCDFMGLRGLVLDLLPEIMPNGSDMMLFHPNGLEKKAQWSLPPGAMVMILDGDVADKLRPVLKNARVTAKDELERRNRVFKNGTGA
jgi:hypothetical protein